jgi:serine/threonine protein kinase
VLLATKQGYSFEIDIWSYGILVAELIGGQLPFENVQNPMVIEE